MRVSKEALALALQSVKSGNTVEICVTALTFQGLLDGHFEATYETFERDDQIGVNTKIRICKPEAIH